VQGQRAVIALEDRAIRAHLELVRGAPVVEAGRDFEVERHRAARDAQHPDDGVTIGRDPRPVDRHEVADLADAIRRQEPGDQDRGVRKVQLLGDDIRLGGPQAKLSALAAIEQRSEHARCVEPGAAEPVDGPLGVDERTGLLVADQPMFGDRGVVVGHDGS
jgi:hypothetical protein